MTKINVDDILEKMGGTDHFAGPVYGEFAYSPKVVKAAIKEIISQVVDRCAEVGRMQRINEKTSELIDNDIEYVFEYNGNGPDCEISVDKQSILDVKNMVDYE